MSAPDGDDLGLFAKLVAVALAVIMTPLAGVWIWFESRFARREELRAIWKELDRRREQDHKLETIFRDHINEERDRMERFHSANQDRLDSIVEKISDLRTLIANRSSKAP